MRLSYFHLLAANEPAVSHVTEFAAAVAALDQAMSVHALGGGGDQRDTLVRPATGRLRSRLSPYAHEVKSLLCNPVNVCRGLAIVRREQPDVIIARHHDLDVSLRTVAKVTGTPLVLEFNSPAYERNLYPSKYFRIPYVDERIEAAALRGASRVLVVTRALGRFIIDRYGVDPGRVIVNSNGANPPTADDRTARIPILDRFGLVGKKVVGFAGSLHAWRRPDLLVGIIDRLAGRGDVGFLLVGDGPDWDAFRLLLAEANLLSRVALTGRVAHGRMGQYLSAMDIALLPASAFYMSPLKLFEYMAAGLPTVAPRGEAIEDIVSDGTTALLFTPGDGVEATHCVVQLLENEEQRRQIGEAAARRVDAQFTWRHNAERALGACKASMEPPSDAQVERERVQPVPSPRVEVDPR